MSSLFLDNFLPMIMILTPLFYISFMNSYNQKPPSSEQLLSGTESGFSSDVSSDVSSDIDDSDEKDREDELAYKIKTILEEL